MRALSLLALLLLVSTTARSQEIWRELDGPVGGKAESIVPIDDDHIAIMTYRGVFFTSDGGATWRRPAGLRRDRAWLSVGRSGTIYARQFNGRHPWRYRPILYRSTDMGATFSIVGDTTEAYPRFLDAVIETSDDGDLLLPGIGLWRFDAARDTMMQVGLYPFQQSRLHGNTIYAWNGLHFVRASLDAPDDTVELRPPGGHVRSFVVPREGVLVVVSGESVLHRSLDSGATWKAIWDLDSGQAITTALDSAGALLVTNGLGVAFRSTDLGDSWHRLSSPAIRQFWSFHVGPDGRIAAEVSDTSRRANEFLSSDGGSTWREIPFDNGGIWASRIVSRPGHATLLASELGYYRTVDGGATWQHLDFARGFALDRQLTMAPDGTLYESPRPAQVIFKSTDDGLTWTRAFEQIGKALGQLAAVGRGEVIGVTYDNAIVTLSESDSVARSYQTSDTWNGSVAIAVDSAGVFYVAIDDGFYRSTDRGTSWTRTATLPVDEVTSLAVANGGTLIAHGWSSELARSTDGGLTWETIQPVDRLENFMMVAASPSGMFYAATDFRGVLRSTDDGLTWHDYSSGLVDQRINWLSFGDDGLIYAVASQAGVYVGSEGVSSVEIASGEDALGTLTIVPNPASTEATVSVTLTRAAEISLALYTALGEHVATVAGGTYPAGRSSVGVRTGGLAGGVYFLRLDADGTTRVRRIIVR